MANLASTLHSVLDTASGTVGNAAIGTGLVTSTSGTGICIPSGGLCSITQLSLTDTIIPCCNDLVCLQGSIVAGAEAGSCVSPPNTQIPPIVTTTSPPILSTLPVADGVLAESDGLSGLLGDILPDGATKNDGVNGILSGDLDGLLGSTGVTDILGNTGLEDIVDGIGLPEVLSGEDLGVLSLLLPDGTSKPTTFSTSYYLTTPTNN